MKKNIRKKIGLVLMIVGLISLFFSIINLINPKQVMEDNPFIIEEGTRPMIAAHRGGKNLNPENTFLAFDYSIEHFDIDIIELDLCLTKDNYLVLNHNLTINDCTDVEEDNYLISEHNLEELQKYNFGYNFEDKNGGFPYRNILDGVEDNNKSTVLEENKLRIVTVEELFEKYHTTDLLFIMEIKDPSEIGYKAVDRLVSLLEKYDLKKRVVVGTFHDEIEKYLEKDYSDIMRGGSVGAVTGFVITQMFRVNLFDSSTFVCLQIPTSRGFKGMTINLDKKTYIDRAHRRGMSVQFWTINDKEEMRRLILLGADVIMTDNPDILYELLNEMGF